MTTKLPMDAIDRMEAALGAMSNGPRSLEAYLAQPGPDFSRASPQEVAALVDLLLSSDPNASPRLRFSGLLRSWDNAKDARWALTTARNTLDRRKVIHRLLRSSDALTQRIDKLLPFFRLEEPVLVAENHTDWYVPQDGVRDYYWSTYKRYLEERRGWPAESIVNLDNTTRAVIECLADPEQPTAYASRGLVMGYVQSGKTANFMGVAARAADAGYRLIIVLAGTWNILRNQTQRRFDKELLGKELLGNDDKYSVAPPDWADFLEHGADPGQLGHYLWQRLTRPDIDFKRLKASIDNLEFERVKRELPIYHPDNLHRLQAKLLVVKKHSGILQNLVKDLKLLRTRLVDLPTLIIDDESDQAGINTIDPAANSKSDKERSQTNQRIVDLLGLFPRGQYVGYTATPYANALVDPNDPEDLFPRDFILSLDRPLGYMGVSDFFDPNTSHEDLKKDDFALPEIAFLRRVTRPAGSDDEDLKAALTSFVLSGGLKLFRHALDADRYRAAYFRHHTMLIHTSSRRGEHASLATRLADLWNECAFHTPSGRKLLQDRWSSDYLKVSSAQGSELQPSRFAELVPHLAEALNRIENGKVFLVVNSDTRDAPDFGEAPVWKIIIGGNKLSRGYTVEGLTVSYYRRVANTGDTLMQMGRWFGFRPGYKDLVRVFLGVSEGKKGDVDLVALFKEVCRREERFRDEIKRYVRRPDSPRITPKQIPPLISMSGSLPPTARNKMFNAVLLGKNFGGQSSMPTLLPSDRKGLAANIEVLNALLRSSKSVGRTMLAGTSATGDPVRADVLIFKASTDHIVTFLETFHWLEPDFPYPKRPVDAALQLEFLRKQNHEIDSWLILLPQRQDSFGEVLEFPTLGTFTVKKRKRVLNRGFQVIGEPPHRLLAEYLAGMPSGTRALASPGESVEKLFRPHTGVVLMYPVRQEKVGPISVGFEIFFPPNNLPFELNLTVRNPVTDSATVPFIRPASLKKKATRK